MIRLMLLIGIHLCLLLLKSCAPLIVLSSVVSRINTDILKEVQGEMKGYLSMDTIMDTELSTSYPVEFLNSLELSGVPSHKLQLKLNVPVMLMRNLNAPLCYVTEQGFG
ncbi:ATP-dependent DNA helicase [Trichonephila clavipes]|uniref:ATP-dependent DNA helicase n=1 Tax=Trichonephila clavipes TaxID=2585209 RepID=A0A8X6SME0_TRICX|nr:ATP-dependent DNA helicase [Trichonephila clavipes]